MAPKVRDRIINALIMTCSGAGVAILAFWLQVSDLEAQQLEEKINDKVDKSEFSEYKEQHTREHIKESETNKEFRDWMRDQMKGLRQDVRDINNKN